MILSDRSIKDALTVERIKITPLTLANIQPASVDLTLHDEFFVFDHTVKRIDPKSNKPHTMALLVENSLDMMPGDFILGTTIERVEIAADLVAQVGGKSSMARLGIAIHVTAGFIDPGFRGQITLEIKNLGILPVRLYPGMKIAQIAFEEMTTPSEKPYGSPGLGSKYQDQQSVTPSFMYENYQ